MSDSGSFDDATNRLPLIEIESLPRSALQALYHVVTGKTETYSKSLRKSVIITHHNFQQLYLRIVQQIQHYDLLADPTITIIVKFSDSKKLQYSSWERFNGFSINSPDITSEIAIKFEFIIQLPNTPGPQRCIVNVLIDSGLPIILDEEHRGSPNLVMLEFYPLSREYRTVEISIDFVDFLIARIFCGVIEEWFATLELVPRSKVVYFLVGRAASLRAFIGQFGRVGCAVFLASYVWFIGGKINSIGNLVYAISISLLIWSVIAITTDNLGKFTAKRLFKNLIPSVTIFTDADKKGFERIKNGFSSNKTTIVVLLAAAIFNISLNIIASYMYTYMTKS